jgi:phosphatidylinositol alpha-1,6-mannosyltransferase
VRALVLTPDFPPAPGGIQLVMSRLVANLRDTEARVVTLAFDGAEPEAAGDAQVIAAGRQGRTQNKVSVARLNGTGLREAARSRPDVVVSGHAVTAPGAAAVRLMTRARVIQYVHADEARLRPRLFSFAVRRADAVVAVSRHARDAALAAGCEAGRVRIVHPGVDPAGSNGVPRAERPTVLTVSRMQAAYKGHDTMIRALPEIRSRVPDVRWVVVGEGRLRPELEELASSLGVQESIHFAGHLSDRERDRWLAAAHVFAMPSRLPPSGTGGEGFGIVFLEAATHGLPVVAGAVGGTLDGLLLDPGRAARLGERGAERARDFTWRRHAATVEELMLGMAR